MLRAHWIHCCLVMVLATAVQGATFFVNAQGGDDTNNGTSASAPLRTIRKAVELAAANPGPDMVQIAEGEYAENIAIQSADPLTLSGERGVTLTASDPKEVINITAGEVAISNLTITSGTVGIKVRAPATSLILRDVAVTNNTGHGVDTRNIGNVTIVQTTCSWNGNDGIHVEHVGTVSVTSTTSANNTGDGADLEFVETLRLNDVTIRDSGDDGLEVDDCDVISVIQGHYSGSTDEGLDIDNTKSISIVGIVATGNPGNGLQIEADGVIESVSIRNSEFSGNTGDGINIVENADGVIRKLALIAIAAEDNGESGVDATVSGSVKVSALKSQDNGAPDALP